MRIAVIGSTGTVGSHVATKLRAQGVDVVEVSRATGVDVIREGSLLAPEHAHLVGLSIEQWLPTRSARSTWQRIARDR